MLMGLSSLNLNLKIYKLGKLCLNPLCLLTVGRLLFFFSRKVQFPVKNEGFFELNMYISYTNADLRQVPYLFDEELLEINGDCAIKIGCSLKFKLEKNNL